ncbi:MULTISPECIES: TIGR00645 family protein [unclassified Paracoccus (in: a-proteobacteria)]|uniref:TIGR00645 family protein n=1 Tax=unclassified Paracoccus (in: a-proteobacteria) TaxID=2688777 RepID=UPI0015FFDC80|nr:MULTISPECIES: TIGR00645 family protein [unclassified Paracoccus (in: a-proteobacteria)]MBB1491130.1 TIGR00645 family protein [Paracoccus sp. MC1854]MBB1497055.1 TIGR00645 family protein [Paracoccus sp. MC1862]QQO44544.1 TIGR00645 family protein [Paracoccus sp. MC1862]
MEKGFERLLSASRWLLAPMYLGLVAVMGMLLVVFLRQTLHYLPQALTMTTETAIVTALSLSDLTLTANLLLIVVFSGYENFVSRLDVPLDVARPSWMGTVDFAGQKMKLIASIVAISAIDLLKRFMEVGRPGIVSPDDRELKWLVIIHVVFVFSGLLMAATDWLAARSVKKQPES